MKEKNRKVKALKGQRPGTTGIKQENAVVLL